MDTHWFSFTKKGVAAAAGKGFRIASALTLLTLTFGPLPNAPMGSQTPIASADNLEWSDARPVLSDEADSDEVGGFTTLNPFGNALHAIAVAPNGDIFTAGGTVASATPLYTANPTIYRSTNGGLNWRQATEGTGTATGLIPVGATVNAIAVAPDYPSDNTVIAVYSNRNATGNEALDGIAISQNGGVAFGLGASGAFTATGGTYDLDPRAIAISPDFDADDNSGFVAIGGVIGATGTHSVFRISAANLIGESPATPATGWVAIDCPAGVCSVGGMAAGDGTIALAYSPDEEPVTLGQLYIDVGVATNNAFGLISSGTAFTVAGGGQLLDDTAYTAVLTATDSAVGGVAFDDDYELNGTWFAALGTNDGTVGDGGVYRFTGAWEELTNDEQTLCKDVGYSSITVSGNASDTKVVAAREASNTVCRSSNNGNSFSDDEADGDPDVAEGRIDDLVSTTRLAGQRGNAANVYWTSSGARGGVASSTNGGTTWRDSGLTNQPYAMSSSIDFISATEALARVVVPAPTGATAVAAVFYTNNFGTGAGWRRVDRTPDVALVELPDDYATAKTVWLIRVGTGDERVMRSTDGGMTYFATGGNPTDDEDVSTASAEAASASTLWLGSDEGHVFVTRDGGSSWVELAKDFGNDIDEFDFASDTVFFVSAIDSDNFAKVWQTRDGGATFTQLGDTPWGTGCVGGNLNFRLAKYDATKNEGFGIMMTEADCSTDEVYRIQIGGATPPSTWTDLDLDNEWENIGSWSGPRGDGYYLWLWDGNGVGSNAWVYTTVPLTGDTDDMTFAVEGTACSPAAPCDAFQPSAGTGTEADNLLMSLPNPPIAQGSFNTAPNRSIQIPVNSATGGTVMVNRIMVFTMPTAFLAGPAPSNPANGASIPANTGDEGIPASLRWGDVAGADAYDVLLGQQPDLTDGAIITPAGGTTSSRFTVTEAIEALVPGVTYYWSVRVQAAEGSEPNGNESAWSEIRSFSVSTTSPTQNVPTPNLPLNGSQLPGLTGELSWNNPPGVSQVQIQVRPLNDDGPAINLIIGSPISRYVIPAPVFGTGPYVILPGAGYTWLTRVTGSTSATITENDPGWGPWSEPRQFTTRRPDSGTIQQLSPINGETVTDTTPSLQWKNAATDEFYYEVQLSADPNFNMDSRTATASVFWNLLHGGQSNPPNSWTVPDANALKPGTYYWRVRQRLQATPAGSAEVGVAWSPAQRFVVG